VQTESLKRHLLSEGYVKETINKGHTSELVAVYARWEKRFQTIYYLLVEMISVRVPRLEKRRKIL